MASEVLPKRGGTLAQYRLLTLLGAFSLSAFMKQRWRHGAADCGRPLRSCRYPPTPRQGQADCPLRISIGLPFSVGNLDKPSAPPPNADCGLNFRAARTLRPRRSGCRLH